MCRCWAYRCGGASRRRVPFVSVDFFAADPQTQPSLNGCLGTILEWDADQERWKVGWNDVHLRLCQMITMLLALYAFFHVGIGLLELGWYSFVSQKSMNMRRKFWQSVKLQSLTVHTKFIPHDGSMGLVYFTYDKLVGSKPQFIRIMATEKYHFQVLMDDGSGKLFRPNNLEPFRKERTLEMKICDWKMTPHDSMGPENLKKHPIICLVWSTNRLPKKRTGGSR